MGAGNVSLAYICWAKLPDRAFRLLTYMALVSMDTDRPPRFWGGYPALARAVGRNTPDVLGGNATDAEKKARTADFEAVRIGMRVLLKNEAIALDEAPAPGRNPVYRLNLLVNAQGSAWATPQGSPVEHPRDGLSTPQGSPVDLGGVGGVTFDDKEEEKEFRNTRGTKSPYVTNSLAISANEMPDPLSAAMKLLNTLPDLGQKYLGLIPAETEKNERFILAAEMARAERNAS